MTRSKKTTKMPVLFYAYSKKLNFIRISGIPKGIRTPVTAVKGRCPRPLDDRDTKIALRNIVSLFLCKVSVEPARPNDIIPTKILRNIFRFFV